MSYRSPVHRRGRGKAVVMDFGAPAWSRRRNHLKEALREGRPATSMFITVPWPPLVEIAASYGLDAVMIDLEHVSYSLNEVQSMIIAADAAGVSSLVRVPSTDPLLVTRVLDTGAHGIVFPLINDAATAEQARAAMRFPPNGVRGWGGAHTRHAMWQGATAADTATMTPAQREREVYSEAYLERAEDLVSVWLVETTEGVENIDEILEVGGVDAVMFGLGDYTAEVRFDFAAGARAEERVYNACRAHNVGSYIPFSDQTVEKFYPGSFFTLGVDALNISAALGSRITHARSVIAQHAAAGSER